MHTILGQRRALEFLRKALRSDRFHHAWIFSGPRGVGKFTTAVEIAKILLDQDAGPDLGGEIEVDPTGRTSRLVDAGTHPDLHVVRKELVLYSENRELRERKQLNIPIALLRERVIGGKVGDDYVEGPAYRTAAYGHGKVFIIDEAELLAWEGQSSLLKTLEEPPRETYFFLITSRPDRLLSTIHSRCQHVRFARLDESSMREWFKRSAIRTDPDTLAWIEKFAEGSPGIAQLAIQYGFHGWNTELEPLLADVHRGKFPVAMGDTMGKLVDEFALAWVKNHKNASKDAANKDGARHLFSLLAADLRQRLASSCKRNEDPSRPMVMIDLLREAESQLDSNVNLKMLLENLVVQWSQPAAVFA